jgi:hypothetical protein
MNLIINYYYYYFNQFLSIYLDRAGMYKFWCGEHQYTASHTIQRFQSLLMQIIHKQEWKKTSSRQWKGMKESGRMPTKWTEVTATHNLISMCRGV